MVDPFAEVVRLLQPQAPFSKLVSGAGRWSVRRDKEGRAFYCAVLEGACRLTVNRAKPLVLRQGDFALIPSVFDFLVTSLDPPKPGRASSSVVVGPGEVRHGDASGPPDVRMLVGHCVFGSPDAQLLVSLLPRLVHVRGVARLATLVDLVREESREQRPAREVVLARLLEVLFIEALRSNASVTTTPGLLRGLADERLATALRRMHESPASSFTVAQLAKAAALSRSVFFERFSHAVGVPPMQYLLTWRMALAKHLLARERLSVGEVAERVGYSSGSTFCVAFIRHVGVSPTAYARRSLANALLPTHDT